MLSGSTILGGWWVGWVGGWLKTYYKASLSPQLKLGLGLGLSLAKNRALYLSRFCRGGPTKSFRQQILESKNLEFFASTSKFYNKSRTSFQIFSPNTQNSLSVFICKRNEVNWAKNDRVRAVFVDEVKIRENSRISRNRDFRHFGGNLDSTVRVQFWGD